MRTTITLLAAHVIQAQDFPWPGVLNLSHIQDGFILAEEKAETAPEAQPGPEPEAESPHTDDVPKKDKSKTAGKEDKSPEPQFKMVNNQKM